VQEGCKFAVAVPNAGPFANPKELVHLAELAEASGWDGFFLWDHSLWSWPEPSDVVDPWTVLGAIAQVTQTISIGTMITPIARRRPWQLAREVTTLDHLSGGRVILGVGLGSPPTDFIPFWSSSDHVPDSASQPELLAAEVRERRRRYEVGLELLERFLAGEVVDHDDELFTVREVELRPRPSADHSIPILVGGNVKSAQAIALAAGHAGGVPIAFDGHDPREPTFEEITEYAAALRKEVTAGVPLVALWAHTDGTPRAKSDVARYVSVGVNWWIETVAGADVHDNDSTPFDLLETRIKARPLMP
jgi:alkanesulfonate monooxygenase SsuD/methylene tetrahydromethanopterin reductase-like flavin-dependent oxidoreductase (luciferase family)